MAEVISFQLDGTDQILDALSALDTRQIMNVIKAVERRDLSQNVIKPLRSAVPYSSKSKKAIRIVQDKNDRTGFFAGVTSDRFILRFVEKGTEVRKTKKGANRGQIIAKPSAIPTIEGQTDSVINFFNEDFGNEVNRILEKKIKKLNK